MRFGITPLSFPRALQTILSGQSIDFSRFSYPKIIREAVTAGFGHVELTLDSIHAMPGSLSSDRLREISEMRNSMGFTVSAHLPLWALEPAFSNERIRSASVMTCVEAIEATQEIEPEYYVFHATGALAAEFTRLPYPEYTVHIAAAMGSFALKSLREIIEGSGLDSRKIAVESVEFPLEITRGLAGETDCSLLLDTGHVLAGYSGRVDLAEALDMFLPRMVGVHAHDGLRRENQDGTIVVKDHLPLGSGDMRVSEFFGSLLKAGFKGPVVFELPIEDALRSLEVLRSVVPDAFE